MNTYYRCPCCKNDSDKTISQYNEIINSLNTLMEKSEICCNKINDGLNSILEKLDKLDLDNNDTDEDEELDQEDDSVSSDWGSYIGGLLTKGTIVEYDGNEYMVMQDVYPDLTQTPNSDGMLAIYQIYRGSETLDWLCGEYVEIGWIRIDEDCEYKAIQSPNPNTTQPSLIPAIWVKI